MSEASGTPSRSVSSFGWRSAIDEHLGLTISAIAFFLVSFRVLGLSDYDTLTALALVQAGGAVNVALGSALASASTVAAIVLMQTATRAGMHLGRTDDDDAAWNSAPYLWIVWIFWVMAQWWVLLMAVGLFLLAWWRTTRSLRPASTSNESRSAPISSAERRAWLVASIVPQILVTASQPWLPSEVLNVRGERPFTAYVVAEKDESVVILRREKRNRIDRIPEADITKRELCTTDQGLWGETLIGLAASPRYRTCPEVER